MNMIYEFLTGKNPDNRGRWITDYFGFSYKELEILHDYIQWMFPLPDASMFNKLAPILTPDIINKIKQSTKAKGNLEISINIIVDFYLNTSHWANPNNHNLLRITRILKSIRLLFNEDYSRNIYDIIISRCHSLKFVVPTSTLNYWKDATNECPYENRQTLMSKYVVYSIEYGNTAEDPFHETDDREEAEMLAISMSINSRCRWYVLDTATYRDIFVHLENTAKKDITNV